MAVPPSSPGYHAARMAGTCASAQLTASALPPISTSTTGLPSPWIAASSASCGRGSAMSVRSPPAKPSTLHRHLLALQRGRQPHDHHHDLGVLGHPQCLRDVVLARHGPQQLHLRIAAGVDVVEAHVVEPAPFQFNRDRPGEDVVVVALVRQQLAAIQPAADTRSTPEPPASISRKSAG